MNKTLQDYVWSILPKEFKEEVKRLWSVEVDCATKYHSELHKHRVDLLYELFGEHLHWQNSLTSNEEGEEMLTCVKDQAAKLYNIAYKAYTINGDKYYQGYMNAMIDLFGSKGLPDELNENNFAKSEPKFHKGDKVEVINYDFGLPSLSRCVHEVFTVSDVKYNANQWMYKLETNKWLFNERDYLESIQWCEHFLKAYKEPQPAEPKFKEGDRAIYCIPEKQRIKARVVNVRQRSGSTLFNTLFNYDIRLDDGRTANWVDEQWLLPDNDDQVRAVTKKASEHFDNILAKDLCIK